MPSDLVQGVNAQTGATLSFPDSYFYCGDFVCDPHHNHVALAPGQIRGIQDSSGIIFLGVGGVGAVASDIGEVEGGQLFGTRFAGNEPLLNSNDYLRVGWSYIKGTGEYVFRIGGKWVPRWINNGHINLWPPSWWFGPPGL